jgi:hypothetical protein
VSAIVLSVLLQGTSTARAASVGEDELYSYLAAMSTAAASCDVQWFAGIFAPDIQIIFEDSGRRDTPSRRAYLDYWQALCRAGGGAEGGFRVTSSSHRVGDGVATMTFDMLKEYQLGLVHRRRVRVEVHQEYRLTRRGYEALQVRYLYQRSQYRDLADQRIVPWEEVQPIPPLTRLVRQLLGPWLLPADQRNP